MSEETLALIEAAVRRVVEPLERRIDVLTSRLGDSLLDRGAAAAYLGCSTRTLDRRVESKHLKPATPKGKPKKFTIEELDRAKAAGHF